MVQSKLRRAVTRALDAAITEREVKQSGRNGHLFELMDLEELPTVNRSVANRQSILESSPLWPQYAELLQQGLPEGKAIRIAVIGNRPQGRMAAMVRHYLKKRQLHRLYRVMATKKEPGSVFILRVSARERLTQTDAAEAMENEPRVRRARSKDYIT